MLSVPNIGTFTQAMTQLLEFSAPLRAQSTKSTPSASNVDGNKVSLLFDGDGFVGYWLNQPGPSGASVAKRLPLDDETALRILTLHQLMRATVVVTAEAGPQQELLDGFSRYALLQAVIVASDEREFSDDLWLTSDLKGVRQRFLAAHPNLPAPKMSMTLDRRFTAFTDVAKGAVTVSALTREYLMRINILALNLAVGIVQDGLEPSTEDQQQFTEILLMCVFALRGDIKPSQVPTVRPNSVDIFSMAQTVTTMQMVFLVSHEFAHIVHKDWDGTLEALEEECDKFAFADLEADGRAPSYVRYLALRWLFEVLAFDRVANAALFYRGDDWENGVDWLQLSLRKRRRDSDTVFKDPKGYTSPFETGGSLFFIFARHEIRAMGRKELLARRRSLIGVNPGGVGEELTRTILGLIDSNSQEALLSLMEVLNNGKRSI